MLVEISIIEGSFMRYFSYKRQIYKAYFTFSYRVQLFPQLEKDEWPQN